MAAPSSTLQNVYYERKVGTARACYVCHRPTETVLATIKTEDYLYTCDRHLNDPGFATQIAAPPPGPSADDIRKVVSDFHAREAKKAEKKKDDEKDKDKEQKDDEEKSKPSTPASPLSPGAGIPNSQTPTHKKYALHRSIFEARKAEIRRRDQTSRAKEVSKGMPQVPRGSF